METSTRNRDVCLRAAIIVAATLVTAQSNLFAQAQTVQHYKQTNLVSNLASMAPTVDPNLVNPWGLSRSSGSPWWVSDNGTGVSSLYDGTGAIQQLVVKIPPSEDGGSTGTPTGTIFNGTKDFEVAKGKPAIFLFVSEDGAISGWNPTVNLTQAVKKVDHEERSVYKGATIASVRTDDGSESYLYVADFRQGRIRVFDTRYHRVHEMEERFDDDSLPAGYAPFNVQNIGGNLYVAFAKQDSAKHDEVDGEGLGYVDVFTPRGKLIQRLEPGPWFNAPWGMTQASSDFGAYSHDLLVGQFGSGEILAFNPVTGRYKGKLHDTTGKPLHIDGLWGLSFGNDGGAGPATSLYFAAGINHEQDGLLGVITAVENPQGNDQ